MTFDFNAFCFFILHHRKQPEQKQEHHLFFVSFLKENIQLFLVLYNWILFYTFLLFFLFFYWSFNYWMYWCVKRATIQSTFIQMDFSFNRSMGGRRSRKYKMTIMNFKEKLELNSSSYNLIYEWLWMNCNMA